MGVCLLAISQAPRCNFPVAFLVFILKPGCNAVLLVTDFFLQLNNQESRKLNNGRFINGR